MKDDEREFLCRIAFHHMGSNEFTRAGWGLVVQEQEMKMNWKRAEWLYEKWMRKGWWNCGVSPRTGWLEEKGYQAALEIARAENEGTTHAPEDGPLR